MSEESVGWRRGRQLRTVAPSRRLLVDTLNTLDPFADAVTVIGAHAVFYWVQQAIDDAVMQPTRDADVVLHPARVGESPKLIDLMSSLGLAMAMPDRPGIYGLLAEQTLPFSERTTIDLLTPETYAGKGRRSATIPGQKNATTRALGLELALWDRHLSRLSTFDEPYQSAKAWIAGPASLLVAKAHKVHERLAQSETRPGRLRVKDSGDIALLMMVCDPANVASIMASNATEHPEIHRVVADAATWLIEMYSDPNSRLPQQAGASLAMPSKDPQKIAIDMSQWVNEFAVNVQTRALTSTSSAAPHSPTQSIESRLKGLQATLSSLPILSRSESGRHQSHTSPTGTQPRLSL